MAHSIGIDDAFDFRSPVQLHYSRGAIDRLGDVAATAQRVLVVTGRSSARKSGVLDRVCSALAGREVAVFDQVEPNPSIDTTQRGAAMAAATKADLVIGLGGGSAMDAAKVVAVLGANEEGGNDGNGGKGFREHFGKESYPSPPIRMIAVPTTCGTGSEANHYAIITDPDAADWGDKINFSGPLTYPAVGVLDPTVLDLIPRDILVATAMDAFTHAFEGYTSRRSQPLADTLAAEAMALILQHLPAAAEGDEQAKGNLLYASCLAGIVIAHTGTTMLHALGYYLTLRHGVPHGLANAVLLPVLLDYLQDHIPDKVGAATAALPDGGDAAGMTRFLNGLGIDTALSAHGIVPGELETWAEYAAGKGNTPQTVGQPDSRAVLALLQKHSS